jgi:(2R)-sulfolactate sulfo-lyase subunit alpha
LTAGLSTAVPADKPGLASPVWTRPPPKPKAQSERGRRPPAALGQARRRPIEEPRMSTPHLLVHDHKDNVGVVVVEGLKAGTDMLCVVTEDNSSFRLTARQDVPIGHKVALKDLREGDTAIKYGQDIGLMKGPAAQGDHVHTHNLKTKRW